MSDESTVETTQCSAWLVYEPATGVTNCFATDAPVDPFFEGDGFEVTVAYWQGGVLD